MKKGKILSTKLTKAKKDKIYQSALQHFKNSRLNKTCHFFQVMMGVDERIDWLLRIKNFFSRYKNASFEELKLIKENFKIDSTLEETIQMWHEDNFYTTLPNFQSAMETYAPLLGSLDFHLNIVDELDALTKVYCNEKTGKQVLIHPIDGKISERYYKQYMREKHNLIDALIEVHPERENFIKIVPNNLKRTNPSGRKPMYPVRRELTQSFWEKHETNVKKQVKKKLLKKAKDKAKDEDKSESNVNLNNIDIPARDIVEELKTQMPFIEFLETGTIKTWIGLK